MIELVAENDIGCIDSLEKSLKVLLVTGLNDIFPEREIVIYPNPASGTVFINTNDFSENVFNLQVFNELGKTVLEKKFSLPAINRGINLSHLSPGIYYLGLHSENYTYAMRKLILK